MKVKIMIFFVLLLPLLTGREIQGNDLPSFESPNYKHHAESFFSLLLQRLKNIAGIMSAPYLLKKLSILISEHPLKAMALAIFIGVLTNENKKNIIKGIKKLRNSAYRVIGFKQKVDKKDTKEQPKEKIKFIAWGNRDEKMKRVTNGSVS